MTVWIGLQHSLGLVALSVVMAVFGGYVGLGLAGQARLATGLLRRGLLAGAAWSLGLGIWTMHFVGMLAVRLPDSAQFSVLLTLLSFLLCVLVVGIAAFLVSIGNSSRPTIALAAIIMGAGIVGMHYLGMHAVVGSFMLHHDLALVFAATLVAVVSSYWALRIFTVRMQPAALALSAVIFGIAVSGMHFVAMLGMHVMPLATPTAALGPTVSSDVLMIAVAFLAFVVSGGFLLYLVPETNRLSSSAAAAPAPPSTPGTLPEQPQLATLVPVEIEGATRMIPVAEISAIQATTHYTLVFDGRAEHLSPWSITEAESRLEKAQFMRVHRSHLIAIEKVKALRKSGDGALVEVGGPVTRAIPVSRTHYAELKLRLGLQQKLRARAAS
ncbi:MAG: MHYT domain-containing protein [Hyphomicrobiales bacterium]